MSSSMRLFVDGLPFSDTASEVIVPEWPKPITLKPFQALMWISLSPRGLETLPGATPRLPVLLDTGNNFTLSLREEFLDQAGLELPLPWSTAPLEVRDGGGATWSVKRLLVDIWLHSNLPDLAAQPYPVRLVRRGIACYPASGPSQGPPLPLLGLAALCAGSITLEMPCHPKGGTIRLFVPSTP